jgi:hypothetical protein
MKTRVYIIESEAGWGSKVDEVKEFDTREEAEKFTKEYNDKYNPPGPTPSWYMIARIEGTF